MVKGVFAKKETLYWLNPNKIRIWSLQILLLSIIGIPLRGIVRNSSSIARNIEELRGIAKITGSAIARKRNPHALETLVCIKGKLLKTHNVKNG